MSQSEDIDQQCKKSHMSRQYSNLLINASNEAILIVKDGKILTSNPFADFLFDYQPGRLIQKPVFGLFTEEDHTKVRNTIRQCEKKTFEATAVKYGGSTFIAQVLFKSFRTEQGQLSSFSIRDVTRLKKSESDLLARDALLESISFTAARFLESKYWRNEILDVLKIIGKSARVSRVYIFQNFRDEEEKLYMSQKYEWVAEHVDPEIDNPVLERLYYHENGLDRLVEVLAAGDTYKGIVRELPQVERAVLEAQGILSIFITPIFQNGEWWGFIGYDECNYEREWNASEIQLLNTSADIFNSALERESIEERITSANKNFKSLFHHSPDGIFVYSTDGHVLDVNEAGCRLNGLPREQLTCKHVTELVPEEIREQVEKDFQSWAAGRFKFLESQSLNVEGKTIPVEIRGAKITFFEKPAVLLLVRDISKRKRSEELLKKRMEFIQFISRISSEFIKMDLKDIDNAVNKALQFVCRFTSNERGYVFTINEAETLMSLTNEFCEAGFKPHKGILDSIRVEDFREFIGALRRGENLIIHSDEIPDDAANARMRQILEKLEIKTFINIPLIVGDHFLGYIGFDNTRQKTIWDTETTNAFMLTGQIIANTIIRKKNEDEIIEAKNKAEQSDHLKTAFLGQMSHEMRTPLNSIIGFAEMLERDLHDTDFTEMAGYIVQGGNRLLNTFNLVIDLSEIEANVLQAKMEELNLNRFISDLVPVFTGRAKEKNLTLEFTGGHDEIIITADNSLLEKVVYNLVDNAIKYTPEGSVKLITGIEKESETDFAVLKVIDTGIGISEDKIEDIFTKFRQASEGNNREFEGAGLGLSVTKGMVELMGGKIFVTSTPRRGSEFSIRFPLTAIDRESEVPESVQKGLQEIPAPKILVVEDEIVHQKYIRYILKEDYELTFAENGIKALELANSDRFDLIIMDINLGKNMNGMETIEQIRKMEKHENIPAIAATANVMKGHKELFLSKGFTHYLAKPYRAQEMKALVQEILHHEKIARHKSKNP